jgi:ribosomal protein S18 acetylase RimI-like enzyme
MTMKTRKIESSDIKYVANLFNQYRLFYKQGSDQAGAENFITERMAKNESVIFVVEDNAQVVGFAQLYPSFSSVSLKRLWILNDLFVNFEHRGKGAAKALLSSCAEFAKSTGARGLTLKTAHDNTTAQKLYESLGWKKDVTYLSYNLIVEEPVKT